MVTFVLRKGLHSASVTPGVRFSEAVGCESFHGHDVRQEAFFELLIAELVENVGHHVVDANECRRPHIASCQSFENETCFQATKIAAPLVFTHVNSSEAKLCCLFEHFNGEVLCFVPLSCVGFKFFRSKFVSHLLDHFLIFVKACLVHKKRHTPKGRAEKTTARLRQETLRSGSKCSSKHRY